MIKLTKEEIEVIERAAVMIETGEDCFSCLAIEEAAYLLQALRGYDLRQKYARFYGFFEHTCDVWDDLPDDPKDHTPETQNRRVLMLLWFAEVCGE